jgi:hypothetical protein
MFKKSVRTSKRAPHHHYNTNINWLTLFKEVIAVYTENRTDPTNTKCRVVKAAGAYNYHSALKG